MKRKIFLTVISICLTAYVLLFAVGFTPVRDSVINAYWLFQQGLGIKNGLTTDTLTTTGAVTIGGNMAITGNETFTGNKTIAGDVTVSAESTGGNAGAKNTIQGLPKIAVAALGTMTNGSTETTSYMDDTPGGEWGAVGGTADPTDTESTTIYRAGAKSLKLAWLNTAVDGDGVTATIANDDLEANESIGFWFYTDTALAAGDIELVLTDDGGARTFNFPAVSATSAWQWIEIDISSLAAGTGDVCSAVSLLISAQGATNLGAWNCYIDGMYKWDATDEEALGQNIIQDGVLSVLTIATEAATVNTPAALVEYTDYFVNYQTGNDVLIPITDQSAASGISLIAYQ